MNAKYLGKKREKNEFGDVVHVYDPCVMICMKEREEPKFLKMMKYIEETYSWKYKYDLFAAFDEEIAYVEVADREGGEQFLEFYKEAKRAV